MSITTLQEIRAIAVEMRSEASTHAPRQKQIARIIEIIDEADNGRQAIDERS